MNKKGLLCMLGILLLTGCVKRTEEPPPSEQPLSQEELEAIAEEEEAMNNAPKFNVSGDELAKELAPLDGFKMNQEDDGFYVLDSKDKLVQLRFWKDEMNHIEIYTQSKTPTKDETTLTILKQTFKKLFEVLGYEYDEQKLISILDEEIIGKKAYEEVYNSELLIYYYITGNKLEINLKAGHYEES